MNKDNEVKVKNDINLLKRKSIEIENQINNEKL
jgi:hypothetical protein